MAAGTDTPAGSAALDYSAPPPPRTGFAQNAAGPGQGICSHRGLSRHGGRVTVRLGVSPPETGLVSGQRPGQTAAALRRASCARFLSAGWA